MSERKMSLRKMEEVKRRKTRMSLRKNSTIRARPSLFRLGSFSHPVLHKGDGNVRFCSCPNWMSRRAPKDGNGSTSEMLGSTLTRFTSKGKRKRLFFYVDYSTNSLAWCPLGLYGHGMQSVFFSLIKEVRAGQRTQVFEKALDPATEHLSFSVIYRTSRGVTKTLDLVCETVEEYRTWTDGLCKVISTFHRDTETGDPGRDYAMRQWKRIGAADSILKKDLHHHFRGMNLQVKRSSLLKRFQKFDVNDDGVLDFTCFWKLLDDVKVRNELESLFKSLVEKDGAGPGGAATDQYSLSASEFRDFLVDTQKEDASLADVHEIIARYENPPPPGGDGVEALVSDRDMVEEDQEPRLSYQGFRRYMECDSNALGSPKQNHMHEDMTRPLNEYFLCSSHNTYLMGDQLTSKSSVEMYIWAFRSGCRSVELDLWDGPDGAPLITHGHSVTSAIPAEEVVKVVRDYAFEEPKDTTLFRSQPYMYDLPVILSLENHCSLEQQRVMAKIFVSVLGKRLAMPEEGNGGKLKSPFDLRGCVLLKGKRVSQKEDVREGSQQDDMLFEDPEFEALAQSAEAERSLPSHRGKQGEDHLNQKIAKELSDITYLEAVKIKSWDRSWKSASSSEMSSFGDAKLSLFAEAKEQVVRYNMKQLSRIYPSPNRDSLLKSANYDPTPFWSMGCQMVSMNIQTHDKPMRIAKAFFDYQNGRSGYILKPLFLRSPHPGTGKYFTEDDPETLFSDESEKPQPWTFRIQIKSAQQLPKVRNEVIDPLVVVEMHGVAADRRRFRTSTVHQNGFNPVWNETFEFTLMCPDLATLYVEVVDEDLTTSASTVAYFAMPISAMRQGYRNVQLLDLQGEPLDFCSLFMCTSMEKA